MKPSALQPHHMTLLRPTARMAQIMTRVCISCCTPFPRPIPSPQGGRVICCCRARLVAFHPVLCTHDILRPRALSRRFTTLQRRRRRCGRHPRLHARPRANRLRSIQGRELGGHRGRRRKCREYPAAKDDQGNVLCGTGVLFVFYHVSWLAFPRW